MDHRSSHYVIRDAPRKKKSQTCDRPPFFFFALARTSSTENDAIDYNMSDELIDLDLNPDLYDDNTSHSTPNTRTVEVRDRKEEFLDDEVDEVPMTVPKETVQDNTQDNNNKEVEDDIDDDLEDIDLYPIVQLTLPFQESYALHQSHFTENPGDELTPGQQSKFVNYVDEQLLQIQRRFVKSQVDEELYPCNALIRDLTGMVDIIWTTVRKRIELFGQVDYLIKITNDLEDYLMHYPPVFAVNEKSPVLTAADKAHLMDFFNLFLSLDVKLSLLYDGYESLRGKMMKMNVTQQVRLSTIITRLRIIVTTGIDSRRMKLDKLYAGQNGKIKEEAKRVIDILDVECGRLFEGLFDRFN